jgi:hypothetical protein
MALPQLVQAGVSISPVVLTRAAVYPKVQPLVLNQFVGVSDANTIQVSVIGAALETISLQFTQLTPADGTLIKAFFADPLVNYGEFEFTFIDADSVSHTVRYLEPQLALPEETDSNVSWELILTKV